MKIDLIWAQDKNGVIGVNGELPWHIPEDLINFKKLTLNQTIVMGRKTWDSLKYKPLPKRRNIVLTTQKNIELVDTFDNLVTLLNDLVDTDTKKIFVIGGAQIYKVFWPLATALHITFIKKKCKDGDTIFPFSIDEIKNNFKFVIKKQLTDNAQYQYREKI